MNAILVARVFFDTNSLIYVNEHKIPDKMQRCALWLEELSLTKSAVINLQVINEFINVAIRKKQFEDYAQLFLLVKEFSNLGSTPVTLKTIENARLIMTATNYSWWDCLLLASAKELGCQYFLSEDMADNHDVGGLTIINPFLHLPSEIV